MTDILEYTLDTKQCAQVASFMYTQWQEAMKPPLYVYKDFPTWLNDIISKESDNADN